MRKNLKINYYGFLGFLGFLGFNDPWYFFFFLFFLFFITPRSLGKVGSPAGSDLIERQAKEKAEHLQKIIEFMATHEKVVNNDIEKLLGVSDATAERYLNELENQGRLTQSGKNKGAYYQK